MPLLFRDELSPDVQILASPSVRTIGEGVVRKDVIVTKGRNNRHDEIVQRIRIVEVFGLPEDLKKFGNEQLILVDNLHVTSRNFLIIVVTGGVSSPDDEVNLVLDVIFDPVEGSVQQSDGTVAI